MSFRVTQSMMASNTLANLQLSLGKTQKLQDQLSSGKTISKPSDDPAGARQSLQYRAEIARNKTYSSNADDGMAWLGTADTTLQSSLDSIDKVRTLLLQGANGTQDATSRDALAKEVAVLKDNLISLANTSYNNRPIFSGTSNSPTAFDSAGNYLGDSGGVFRTVGTDASVQVNVTGDAVYGTGSSNLFGIINDVVNHLNSNNDAQINQLTNGSGGVASDLERLDSARINLQNQLSTVGARYHRVDTMQERANDAVINLSSSLSKVEDADMPATYVALNIQNTAYQAALAAASKVIQPSLVDFLR